MSKRSLIIVLISILAINQAQASNLKHAAISAIGFFSANSLLSAIQEQTVDLNAKNYKWPSEITNEFKKELLKHADHKVDQTFLNKITFIDDKYSQKAYARDYLSKDPDINIPAYKYQPQTLLRYILLHELGHTYYQDHRNNIIAANAMFATTYASIIHSGNMLNTLQAAVHSGQSSTSLLRLFGRACAKKLAVGTSLGLSQVLLYKLCRRYQENRADDFAIECLSRQGEAQDLRYIANRYRPTDWYRSETLIRLGIEPTRFYDIKAKAPLASKFIQLIDDEHLPIEEMCMKFDLAALKVDAQNKIKE